MIKSLSEIIKTTIKQYIRIIMFFNTLYTPYTICCDNDRNNIAIK